MNNLNEIHAVYHEVRKTLTTLPKSECNNPEAMQAEAAIRSAMADCLQNQITKVTALIGKGDYSEDERAYSLLNDLVRIARDNNLELQSIDEILVEIYN